MSKRKQHASEFDTKAALEVSKGEEADAELVRDASDDDPSMETDTPSVRSKA